MSIGFRTRTGPRGEFTQQYPYIRLVCLSSRKPKDGCTHYVGVHKHCTTVAFRGPFLSILLCTEYIYTDILSQRRTLMIDAVRLTDGPWPLTSPGPLSHQGFQVGWLPIKKREKNPLRGLLLPVLLLHLEDRIPWYKCDTHQPASGQPANLFGSRGIGSAQWDAAPRVVSKQVYGNSPSPRCIITPQRDQYRQ